MWSKISSLRYPFLLTLLGTYFLPNMIPSLRFVTFAPLITLGFSRLSLPASLFIAVFAGLFLDLYSPTLPLGFFALNYMLTTLLLYRYRKYFLEEKPHIFALYSTLFSFFSTALHFFLYALIDIHIKLRWQTIFTDFTIMPLLDGLYSFIFVLLPLKIYKHLTTPKMILLYRAIKRKYKYAFLKHIHKVRSLIHAR